METLKRSIDCEHTTMSDKELLSIINENEWIEFENGCCLISTGGEVWGTTPYGLDTLCVALQSQNVVSVVRTWLSFWDEPRDESGSLL